MHKLKILYLIAIVLLFFSIPGMAGVGLRTGIVTETMSAAGYIYVKLDEQGEISWLATRQMMLSPGDKIEFAGGSPMKNFQSKTLGRTFDDILFVDGVKVVQRDGADVKSHGKQGSAIPKAKVAEMPQAGDIQVLENGRTISELLEVAGQLQDQQVSVRAKVTKVSENILGKNWITLQDGSGEPPNNRLIATSSEMVDAGDVVTVKGIISTNVDLGSGYNYKVLLEEASFSH